MGRRGCRCRRRRQGWRLGRRRCFGGRGCDRRRFGRCRRPCGCRGGGGRGRRGGGGVDRARRRRGDRGGRGWGRGWGRAGGRRGPVGHGPLPGQPIAGVDAEIRLLDASIPHVGHRVRRDAGRRHGPIKGGALVHGIVGPIGFAGLGLCDQGGDENLVIVGGDAHGHPGLAHPMGVGGVYKDVMLSGHRLFVLRIPDRLHQPPKGFPRRGFGRDQGRAPLVQPGVPLHRDQGGGGGGGGRGCFQGPHHQGQEALAGRVCGQPIDPAVGDVRHIDAASLVLAKAADAQPAFRHQIGLPSIPISGQAPNSAAAIVAKDVPAPQPRLVHISPHKTSGDGTIACAVGIFVDGQSQPGRVAGGCVVAAGPLHDIPAVVLTAQAGSGLKVDLLDLVLAHIGDKEIPGLGVKAEAPGVAQPRGPDLWPGAQGLGEGVGGGNGVGQAGVRWALAVDAQDLAQERVGVLAVAQGIAAAAAVAQTDVEIAVRAKGQLAAVVVLEGLVDDQELLLAGRVGPVGVKVYPARRAGGGQKAETGHHRAPLAVGVVDVKMALGHIVRREGQAQQPSLPATAHPICDVQKGWVHRAGDGKSRVEGHNVDTPGLFGHKEPVLSWRLLDGDGAVEARCHNFQAGLAWVGPGRVRGQNEKPQSQGQGEGSDETKWVGGAVCGHGVKYSRCWAGGVARRHKTLRLHMGYSLTSARL